MPPVDAGVVDVEEPKSPPVADTPLCPNAGADGADPPTEGVPDPNIPEVDWF
jgi:hypothetical protein